MFKKALVMMLTLVAVPTFALADWTISASTSPAAVTGVIFNVPTINNTITPPNGATVTTTGKITKIIEGTATTPVPVAALSFSLGATPPGYTLTSVSVDGTRVGTKVLDVNGNWTGNWSYDVTGPFTINKLVNGQVLANHNIVANYTADAVNKFTVKSIAAAGGWISKSQTVANGANATFTITANPKSTLTGLLIDGVAAPAAATYTFTGVTTNHTIQPVFAAVKSLGAVLSIPSTYTIETGKTFELIGNTKPNYTTGVTYTWAGSCSVGAADNSKPGVSKVVVTAPAAGTSCTVTLVVAADSMTSVANVATITGVLKSELPGAFNCIECHDGTGGPDQKTAFTNPASVHGASTSGHSTCQSCHNPQGTLSHAYQVTSNTVNKNTFVVMTSGIKGPYGSAAKGTIFCAACHSGTYALPTHATVGLNCAGCHSEAGGDAHSVATPTCVGCHSFSKSLDGNANNGVRAIVGEFAKRSHHVTGRAVKDTDCVVCHMEGKKDGIKVVVNPAYHMTPDFGPTKAIFLRNGGGVDFTLPTNQDGKPYTDLNEGMGSYFVFDTAAPDHVAMDRFCFSCHNANGAPAAAAELTGVIGYTGTALNPFGDSVSNSYDQVSRINVVDAFSQFATTNSSHHAVRGQRYTKKNLTGAEFSNISSANYNFKDAGVAAPIKGLSVAVVGTTTATFTAQKVVGTMFETGKFVSTYTIGTTTAMADNSTLHCGDCHTVGQFKAGSAFKLDGTPTTAVIGAHGSNNEYMLRNSNSDDTFAKDALVCFLCHKEEIYNSDFSSNTVAENPAFTVNGVANSSTNGAYKHAGANTGWDCNGRILNSAGQIGLARLQIAESEDAVEATGELGPFGLAAMAKVAAGKYGATAGSPIFGMACANCHNASDKKTFGGIHGNAGNASYTTYSGAKTTNKTQGPQTAVSRKPYRFLPGLGNFRFNGGDSADQWTVRTLTTTNKQGCYTLNGLSTNTAPTKAVASGANVSAAAIADDNGILGSWGACTDHAGSSYAGGRAVTRTILRPLTY